MGVRNDNTTNYVHNDEPNLLNLHKALDYNSAGQPMLRVSPGEAGSGTVSAFGEPYAVSIVPVIQLDAIYGFDNLQMQQYSGGGGSVSYPDSTFVCSTSSTIGSYAVVRSRRFIRYRPGQGVVARSAAMFSTPAALTTQRWGIHNQAEGYSFGYNGTEFGILQARGGRPHIQTFSLGSYTGAQDFTFVLNGATTVVAISADQTTAGVCSQIARTAFPGWIVEASDSQVVFLSEQVAPLNGAFSFAHSGTASHTFVATATGITSTNTWTKQTDWNIDPCDGTGESTINLNWQNFNVFQIQMQWLGAGAVTFSIQNPSTGQMMPIHRQLWSNNNTTLHVHNPNFKITCVANSAGGTTPVTLTVGSWMGAVEGTYESIFYPRSRGVIKKNLAQDLVHHLITIRNPVVEAGKINTREIRVQDISASVDSTDPVVIYMFIESPLATGNHIWNPLPDAISDYSTETGTISLTTNTAVAGFTIGVDGQGQFDLTRYNIKLPPGMSVTMASYSESSVAKISTNIVWAKD